MKKVAIQISLYVTLLVVFGATLGGLAWLDDRMLYFWHVHPLRALLHVVTADWDKATTVDRWKHSWIFAVGVSLLIYGVAAWMVHVASTLRDIEARLDEIVRSREDG
jgi:hypothetical protein